MHTSSSASADFASSNLTSADLTSSDCISSDLTSSDLTSADLFKIIFLYSLVLSLKVSDFKFSQSDSIL
ncbi:pentapeptide repeat-containing protein [Gardnerella vaginalis]|uniref:pentapeptide repeat-containing protein n=1 Tax=Gardnerella vaginalis TaxID=2702 RepID=UPI0012D94B41